MRISSGVLIAAFLVFGGVVQAGPVTWNLTGISFGDGTSVTGSFVFNADTTTFSGLNMTTSGGTSVPATNSWAFNTNDANALHNEGTFTGFVAVDALSANEAGAHVVSLFSTAGPLMTNSGGTINLTNFVAGTCLNADCSFLNSDLRLSTSGQGQFVSDAAAPEPSALILSGSALLLGLIRRKFFSRRTPVA